MQIGKAIGTVIHNVNVNVNELLNTPAVSAVGKTFDKLGPLGQGVHRGADTGGFAVFKGMEDVARALGGPNEPVPYHYLQEWSTPGAASQRLFSAAAGQPPSGAQALSSAQATSSLS